MATKTMEELRKTVELLKEIEQLQDESIRVRMQRHVLDLLGPTPPPIPLNGDTPAVIPPKTVVVRTPEAVGRVVVRSTSDRGKLYDALRALATEQEPLSTADLESIVPTVPSESISKALSGMYKEGMLQRRKVLDQARGGANIEIFKYWVPEPA